MFKKAIFHNISIIIYAHTHTHTFMCILNQFHITCHIIHFKKKKKHNKH